VKYSRKLIELFQDLYTCTVGTVNSVQAHVQGIHYLCRFTKRITYISWRQHRHDHCIERYEIPLL